MSMSNDMQFNLSQPPNQSPIACPAGDLREQIAARLANKLDLTPPEPPAVPTKRGLVEDIRAYLARRLSRYEQNSN
jgi:hypothetical protein